MAIGTGDRLAPPIWWGANAGEKACYFYGPDDIVHELLQPPAARLAAYRAEAP